MPGSWSPGLRPAEGPADGHGVRRGRRGGGDLEEGRLASAIRGSSASPPPTILAHGRYRPCGPSRDLRRHGPSIPGGPPAAGRRWRPVHRVWNLVSCSSRRARPAHASRCRGRRSTPHRSRALCRHPQASTTTTTRIFRALILASAEAIGQDHGPFHRPASASSPTICAGARPHRDRVRRRTKAAVMCCAGSCVARCGTPP